MREIKFRAWDKLTSEMGQSFNLQDLVDVDSYDLSDYIIMQYTGLKDKNGVDIYEGDIIEKLQWDKPFSKKAKSCKARYEIRYRGYEHTGKLYDINKEALDKDPSCFNLQPGFFGIKIYNEKGYNSQNWSEFASCEVIGNIYENPEFLEAKS